MLKLEIVTPEKRVLDTEVDDTVAPVVLPDHTTDSVVAARAHVIVVPYLSCSMVRACARCLTTAH